jgi:D-beta-D-heptose 7-phosphate kinase/D-beta-D-heptose 1-phosphate adenosyltransferase
MRRRTNGPLDRNTSWWVDLSPTTSARYFPDYESLANAVSAWKADERRVALAMGTFDLLHLGHVLFLEKAKQCADLLIVGVDSDAKARGRKGRGRPVISERDRVHRVAHVRHVDGVVIKPESDKRWELVRTVRPHVLVASAETYTPDEVRELNRLCGRVVLIPRFPGLEGFDGT